ncbi:type II toxin-antitoxin system prevent-host-death family antitoxin [Streptomyces galilaeus]|uniref:type II toxin-antitoxin system prevent-host-death family antitoxin n=1 Tax=Streptomyces galilaeus TaxID=33899 RepID=UPI0038F5E750
MSQPAEKRMGVSDVRQNMTEVIAEVRLLGTPVVLTRREKPQAVLVPHGFYEQALRDHALIEHLERQASEVEAGPEREAQQRARVVWEALDAAATDVDSARNIAES